MGIEFEFADSEVGWMMSWSFIVATRDGGATWHPQLDPENLNLNLIDLSSPDRDHAWALGFSGQIYKLVEVL
jgi:photosystem II stability/assembly factor-like uncharacterized protein